MRWGVLIAVVALGVVAVAAPAARAQMSSGRVARTFVEALARDYLDAAMALVSDPAELQTPHGDVLIGLEAVRAYLAEIPRPIEIGVVLPWGGRKIEVHLLAGDTPLVFIFDGAGGTIVFIEVAYDSLTMAPSAAHEAGDLDLVVAGAVDDPETMALSAAAAAGDRGE